MGNIDVVWKLVHRGHFLENFYNAASVMSEIYWAWRFSGETLPRGGGILCLINSLRAKFPRGSTNIFLHFMSFLRICITHVVEIMPPLRQGLPYFTQLISWKRKSCWRKVSRHQRAWYLPCWTRLIRFPHVKSWQVYTFSGGTTSHSNQGSKHFFCRNITVEARQI